MNELSDYKDENTLTISSRRGFNIVDAFRKGDCKMALLDCDQLCKERVYNPLKRKISKIFRIGHI